MFDPHPYEVLAVDPTATNAEILKAFAKAMQRKQYAPDVLAKARKVLMDPADRPLLDYLWGTWRKPTDIREADLTLLDTLDAEIASLDRAIQNLSIDELARFVKAEVEEATGGQQIPDMTGVSFECEFVPPRSGNESAVTVVGPAALSVESTSRDVANLHRESDWQKDVQQRFDDALNRGGSQ